MRTKNRVESAKGLNICIIVRCPYCHPPVLITVKASFDDDLRRHWSLIVIVVVIVNRFAGIRSRSLVLSVHTRATKINRALEYSRTKFCPRNVRDCSSIFILYTRCLKMRGETGKRINSARRSERETWDANSFLFFFFKIDVDYTSRSLNYFPFCRVISHCRELSISLSYSKESRKIR